MMVWAILAIGGLSFVVWAHHMYVSGMNPYFGFFFATTTLIIAIPTALKVYNWVLTLWRGNIHLTVPMLFAIGFVFTFINGGLTGLFLGNVPVDIPLSGTMFVVAHFHMVMAVSPILVVFGAIYHWYPKITGRMLNDTMGKFHFWVTFLGTYAIYYPMHYLGFLGVPRRYYAMGNTDLHSPVGADAERGDHHRGADRGRRADRVHLQPDLELFQRQAGGRQPVARHDARMADAAHAAEAWQLRPDAAGRLSLGLRLQRAGRSPRTSSRRTSRRAGRARVSRRLRTQPTLASPRSNHKAGIRDVCIDIAVRPHGHRRLVAGSPDGQRQAVDGAARDRDRPAATARFRCPRSRSGSASSSRSRRRCSRSSSAPTTCA